MALSLDAALDRPLVGTSGTVERYLMLTLRAPEGATARTPLNLALVVDASGSMSGEKLSRAKDAASLVVRHLATVDRVALVSYADSVTVVAPSTPVTTTARTDLLYRISRIETGGMTNLSGGWLAGCEEVAKHQDDAHSQSRVLVLTDGLANVGITSLEELVEHARQLRVRGIVTSTMGVGADFNEELLEALARHGGGRFQYVETAKHIPDCVQGELGEMLQVSARKVAVEVRLPEGVRIAEFLNDYVVEPLTDGASGGSRLYPGDLAAGEIRRIVLRLTIDPPAEAQARTLRALALYVDAATGRGTEGEFPPIPLDATAAPAVDGQAVDEEVAREVALLLAARAKEEAARLSRQGEAAAAVHVLANARARLGTSPIAADAAVAQALRELESFAELAYLPTGLNRQQVKEMHYQSYLARSARRRYDRPQ